MSSARDGDIVLAGGRLNPLAREIPLPGLAGDIAMDRETAERSLVTLVLTVVELLRQLMERQAIRRVGQGDLEESQVEAVGATLMALEQRMNEICDYFDLSLEDLNLDLGPLGPLLARD
ncbi:MAG TPA: gas vesicle protein K [Streptosporangiaceae bacterium]|nr:gas vesicle protein K [Streptosporangiaceae bacterium]